MPDWKREIRERLAGAELEPTREAEIVDELADHLEDRYAELVARGASGEDARRAALAELRQSRALAAELGRTEGSPGPASPAGAPSAGSLATDLLQDARYAARAIRKSPGFALAVTLTLGLGIGVNSAAFTVVNTLLLNPLPVVDARALVALHTVDTRTAEGKETLWPLSFPNLEDLQERNRVFSHVAAYSLVNALTWMNGQTPERIFAEVVTANYFETLGLTPLLGRFFLPEEGRAPGAHPVLVMGFAPWQHRFAGAPDIVGRKLVLNGTTFTVIGVAPERFRGVTALFGPDLWIPASMTEQVLPAQQRGSLRDREALVFRGAARLRPGVSRAQAEASIDTIAAQLEREYPEANRGRSLALRPLSEVGFSGFDRQAAVVGGGVLMAIVAIVLLISCSNVANLLLARATGRRQEIALRLALGAGRARLFRQLLTEALLLALVSGVVGTLLAGAGTRVLTSFFVPGDVALNFVELRLDARVLAFTLVVSVLTGLVFSLAPAWQASRVDVVRGLHEDGRSAGPGRGSVRLRKALLVGQVALSLVSLVTAGLCLRSIERAYAIDPGFETKRGGFLLVSPGQAGYDRPRSEQFYLDVRSRVAALPGVLSMSWATNLPFFARFSRGVLVEGQEQEDRKGAMTLVNRVDLDYFGTIGIPLRSGRDFSESDVEGSPPVAIVNEAFARRHWPDRDPLLGRFKFAGEERLRQVVGVARDANYTALGEAPQPCVYLPLRQDFADSVVLYVRARNDPADALAAVRREIRVIDPLLWTSDVRTLETVVDQALFGARIGASLLGVFGILALGLASIGLYGVMAHSVNLRRREVGVRMALGASRQKIVGLVLRQGMGLVVTGIALGLLGSLLAGRALSGLLYGLSPADPVSLGGAAAVLLAVAALACYLPARDASRLDPLAALRES